VVPITVSGGVVGLTLHRPPGVAVTAHVSGGTARIKLDAFAAGALTSDLDWESPGASASRPAPVEGASALDILLDGVAKRVGRS
jgi:hypothetical protein